jgi:hypothetical protein
MTTEATQQQEFTPAAPQEQHEWLRRFLGEWTSEGGGANGTETVTALGDLWIVARGEGEMPSQMTLGFDPVRNRFVGTWVGSMMTHHWVYDGERDATGSVITLNSEGPAFDGSARTQNYRDVYEFIDDNHRVLKAYVQNDDGSWQHFMTTDYRRRK